MRLVVSLPLLTRENWGMCPNHRSGHNRAEVGVVGCQFLSTARSLNTELSEAPTLVLSQALYILSHVILLEAEG